MKSLTNYTLLIAFLITLLSCKKQPIDPCSGMLSQGPPLRIGMLLYDKVKGENLVLSKTLAETDIKVTAQPSGKTVTNWRLFKAQNSPLNGMFELIVFHEKKGQYHYNVEIKGLGSVVIAYTITQEKSDNPCRSYNYPMSGLLATDHEFEQFVYQGKTMLNVIKVFIL